MIPMPLCPLDPALPGGFYNTPNEERSEAELALWWERPFACTNPDGTLDVRCLDGGAWDRPTFYGQAGNMQEACLLAQRKLAKWRWQGRQPVTLMGEHAIAMVAMPHLANREPQVLAEFALGDQAGAAAWAEAWRLANPAPDAGPPQP